MRWLGRIPVYSTRAVLCLAVSEGATSSTSLLLTVVSSLLGEAKPLRNFRAVPFREAIHRTKDAIIFLTTSKLALDRLMAYGVAILFDAVAKIRSHIFHMTSNEGVKT